MFSDESRFSLQSDSRRTFISRAPGTRYHQENTIERHRYGGAGWLVWGGIILGSRTDLHVQSVTMTGHIYRDVILEQHVRLFWGAMGAEFLFMDDNARPHRANIVDECLQSEDITRMDWPAYSPDLKPIEHVWDMLGRRIAARQPSPTCLRNFGEHCLMSVVIFQDQIDNLILSMPRRFVQVLKTAPSPLKTEEEKKKAMEDEALKETKLIEEKMPKSSSKKKSHLEDDQSVKLKSGSHTLLVYLKSRTGSFVPHIFYIIEVTPKLTLGMLNELTVHGSVSSNVASFIKQLDNIQNHPLIRSPLSSFDAFETEFRNLIDVIWKSKISIDKERHMKKLVSKWEQLKLCELEKIFKMPKDKITNPRLESGLSSCSDVLKSFFEECVAIPCLKFEETTQSSEYQEVLKTLQKISVKRLSDVADFLEVKAMQNITMASYPFFKYPGLIHFIYIDRNSDCLIAPNVVVKKGHLNGTPSLKQKIWKMVSVGRRYIDGIKNFCCLWKDNDLYFYYNIWFEDSTGRVIKPTAHPNLKHFPKKGIICGNFYKRLVQECFPAASHNHILCYEFFCVHLESTPVETIVDHSRKLCTQLWDFSGAYRTSLDLL
ncbi:Hermansky-Pudlak syndrome 1 [Araneus ventricosus]|uniref:Hermansky-Pudlak syndrome 1 n=1 Tax=Araneus ventricosus TaxID=182803 RepID=A0A4Y2LDW1_ARAVE|nr:Hermansky-Pudlak syndrome 1 [Araneus ventricosus]